MKNLEKIICNEDLMKDAACLDPKNFKKINENGIPNDALKSLSHQLQMSIESCCQKNESFANNFHERSKTLWDELISSRQHKQDSDSQSEEEDDEDVLDQTTKDAMCFFRSGLDVCQSCIPYHVHVNFYHSITCMDICMYSTLYVAYCVILTISFMQVTSERRLSSLKRIKTRLRSLLGQALLDSLITLNTGSDIIKDDENSSFYDRVINCIAESSPL